MGLSRGEEEKVISGLILLSILLVLLRVKSTKDYNLEKSYFGQDLPLASF